MADITAPTLRRRWANLDKAWLALALILAAVAVLDPPQFWPTVTFTAGALLHTAPFIVFAVLAVAYMKATGAETLLAKAFEGRQVRMIFLAAILGGLSPFCSCEVIPFIAAMLALGAPLGAVMAFWLASPLMDPAMFLITSGTIGWDFAVAKAVAAVGVGLMGGFATMALARSPLFADPLRENRQPGGCCGTKKPFQGRPVWRFWSDPDRTATFRETAIDNGIFLLKWLTLAYVIEAVMLKYIPADAIATVLGGDGIGTILLGALVGAPAYLNGYAAVPLVDALLAQGMSQGAAMSFVIAGGVSCIPAAIAVWALVKPRIFFAYFGFGLTGAVLAGMAWHAVA
ncbi:permease [Roseovarius atlanticus]|uniref:permease n=1 Tax=Roseovarius atlanticus TaxID=1641875 RepID=UPI001C965682|nr:permease [Roseovarius atlanticus]MBY5986694.1 permease [Roseovarius atlanticus]MBY6125334.1 permease [Roseovarius atlanticus]MBY6150205.1 permease [Roseovarius atlanticus]